MHIYKSIIHILRVNTYLLAISTEIDVYISVESVSSNQWVRVASDDSQIDRKCTIWVNVGATIGNYVDKLPINCRVNETIELNVFKNIKRFWE